MRTVHEIQQFLEQLAPAYMKMEWDNVGLLCGRRDQNVEKILVALDPFLHVCEEAAEIGADLIVTHHPLIFRAPRSVTSDDAVGQCILFLAAHGISAINAHTNLDQASGGVNDCLAATLGLENVQIIEPAGEDGSGHLWGLLRSGTVSETDLASFAADVKAKLQCPGLRYISGGKPVHRVAVGGGACADEMHAVLKAGCDTFVTSDVKYNQFWDARDIGLNLIDAGHFETENPVCAKLISELQQAFPDVTVVMSQKHGDPVQFL